MHTTLEQRGIWAIGFAGANVALAAVAGVERAATLPAAWVVGLVIATAADALRGDRGRAALGIATGFVLITNAASDLFRAAWGYTPRWTEIADPFEIAAAWPDHLVRVGIVLALALAATAALHRQWIALEGTEWSTRVRQIVGVLAGCCSALVLGSLLSETLSPITTRLPLLAAGPQEPIRRPGDPAVLLAGVGALEREPTAAPLCGPPSTSTPNGHSVIMLLLDDVRMPEIGTIAEQGASFGVRAAGTHADQALPAVFGGLIGTPIPMVAQSPQPRVLGLPAELRAHGYHTLFAWGADLSYHQRRRFLSGVGFDAFIEPLPTVGDPAKDGIGDDELLGELETSIDALRTEGPYFAAALTGGKDGDPPHLGPFYDWYRQHEYRRGTVLVLVGAHAQTAENFDVPFIVIGRDVQPPPDAVDRLGGQLDVPATLRDLLGMTPGQCELGRSLLSAQLPERLIVSRDARDPAHLYVGSESGVWLRDLAHGRFDRVPANVDPARRAAVRHFTLAVNDLGAWLAEHDLLAPPAPKTSEPITRATANSPPLYIAHRGQSNGAKGLGVQNRAPAIRKAIAAGFEWVEVDLNITKDQQIVVLHDSELDGKPVGELTLAELRALPKMGTAMTLSELLDEFGDKVGLLLELKPTGHWELDRRLAFDVARAVEAKPPRHYMFHSFDIAMLDAMHRFCPTCELGWLSDSSPSDRALEVARQAGASFVNIEADDAPDDFVRRAHAAGLRAFVYTIDDRDDLARFGDPPPDGIITEQVAVRRAVGR